MEVEQNEKKMSVMKMWIILLCGFTVLGFL